MRRSTPARRLPMPWTSALVRHQTLASARRTAALLSWPRGGHQQRVSSMALGAKTEVASSLRWTYGFLFL